MKLNVLKPSVNNMSARVFLRAANLEFMAAIEKSLGKAYAEPAADVRGYIAYVKSQKK